MVRISLVISVLVLFISCTRFIEKSIESPVIDGHRVTFRARSESARVVQLAGDWNNWAKGDAGV
ncbi:hypothetical protein J7M07_00025, partial [bacterium]|nr:hypothetical protein [bacterium]